MPNIKSAKKRVLITKKETVTNNDVRTSMKTAMKKVVKAADKEEAMALAQKAFQKIDTAAQKGVIKANARDRYKTRLNKIVNLK